MKEWPIWIAVTLVAGMIVGFFLLDIVAIKFCMSALMGSVGILFWFYKGQHPLFWRHFLAAVSVGWLIYTVFLHVKFPLAA